MEQTTSEVVAGARLAEDAGTALGEIEKVSSDLSGLIQGISSAAQRQSAAASNITATMNTISRSPRRPRRVRTRPQRRSNLAQARRRPAPFGRRLQAAGLTAGRRTGMDTPPLAAAAPGTSRMTTALRDAIDSPRSAG